MLSTGEFKEWASSAVLFLHVTGQTPDEPHPDLLKEKGGRGFPFVVVLDSGGEVVAQLKDRSVEGFGAMARAGTDYAGLKGRKDRTAAEDLRLLSYDFDLDRVKDDEARTRLAALQGLDDAGKRTRDDLLLGLDVNAEMATLRGAKPGSGAQAAVGKKFAEWWAAGREPGPEAGAFQPFFILMLDHAEAAKDVALFEKALKKLQDKFGTLPQAKRFFENQEKRLEALKAPPAAPAGDGEKK